MCATVVCVPGDAFLCSAAISYNGPFTGPYRKSLLNYWLTLMSCKNLPTSPDFQVTKTLGDPLVIRDWLINGLPSDNVSLENAIFAVHGYRWPLLIDPQSQATKWLLNGLSKEERSVTKLSNLTFQHDVETAIKNGVPVLVFDV
jgi:dynein heavy chain